MVETRPTEGANAVSEVESGWTKCGTQIHLTRVTPPLNWPFVVWSPRNPEGAACPPFSVVTVFVRQQAPYRRFDGQGQGRGRVVHPAAQFQAEPGLRIAPVMPQAKPP